MSARAKTLGLPLQEGLDKQNDLQLRRWVSLLVA
jgi:hypothetical protein